MDEEVADRQIKTNFNASKKFMIKYIRANRLMRFDAPYVVWDDTEDQLT